MKLIIAIVASSISTDPWVLDYNWHIGYGAMVFELKGSDLPIWRSLSEAIPFPQNANLTRYGNERFLRRLVNAHGIQ